MIPCLVSCIIYYLCSLINSSTDAAEMTVYLVHSLPLNMSVVQVFVKDKMAAVAHLVGLEQVGYEKTLGINMQVRNYGSNADIILNMRISSFKKTGKMTVGNLIR